MKHRLTSWLFGILAALPLAGAPNQPPITTGSLLAEMANLERLARWPDTTYRTVQFSSFDRRSTTSEAPGWFSNADGFGREPIPAFLKVLREPQGNQAGLYLLADVQGPGVIVRGWSAGMGGILRVYLDPSGDAANGAGTLIWEGPAYDFLARRSVQYLKSVNPEINAANAFSQEDADYFPIPFARGLRVTWEGKISDLHFYHLQVRLYPAGTAVSTFDLKSDCQKYAAQIRAAVTGLTQPVNGQPGEPTKLAADIEPERKWTWSPENKGPGAVRELKLTLAAEHRDAALRGCLLRLAFDGSQRPQVEAPVGDFFGSGPGINPFSSLPFTVETNGTMTCRFVMPYEKSLRLEIANTTKEKVRVEGSVLLSPWTWDDQSLYFRAKWRADHDLLAGAEVIDLPYLTAIGKGVFVGCTAMIMNPTGVPTAGGNWWGEGDEKFLVDGELVPSTFGTGSEDYFNYSWSRPDLFGHPYCGQPLDSGPDTSGYVSNHRFQVMDAIPYEKSLSASLELWAHNRTPGLSYARIAYHYARPGAIDDHRGLMPSDLRIPPLPLREPKAAGGAAGARFHIISRLQPEATAGRVATVPSPVATQLQVTQWQAEKGAKLKFNVPMEKDGRAALHLVAVHSPGGATIKARLDDKPLATDGGEAIPLRSAYAPRDLNVNFKPVEVKAGARELVIECVEPGLVELDYLWVKSQ